MDEDTLKVAIAGFMHDIGCLASTDALTPPEDFFRDYNALHIGSPYSEPKSLQLLTATLIAHMRKEHLLPPGLDKPEPDIEYDLIGLCARSHQPRTPLQWVIATADRIAGGQNRARHGPEAGEGLKGCEITTPHLLPIFEHLMDEQPEGTGSRGHFWHYPLEEVTPGSIFPRQGKSSDSIESQRTRLLNKFITAMGNLAHREENPPLWFEHFESLVMSAASLVPAPTHAGIETDIPLYDHLKISSAFAVALYLYHRSTGTLTTEGIDAIKDFNPKKFLVIGGDFYGIQNFIFSEGGETRKNRSKILRGRSFAVSLFSELASDMICRAIGIPMISTVLNAAGKFIIIAPNTTAAEKAAKEVETKVNDWLMKISYGEMAIGIDTLPAAPQEFLGGNFANLWESLSLKMAGKKCRKIDLDRFGGAVKDYLGSFDSRLERPLCPFCGKRPSNSDLEGASLLGDARFSCSICRDHIFLGTRLVKKDRLAITSTDAPLRGDDQKLIEPIFGEYQVAFTDGRMTPMARSGQLLRYWDVTVDAAGSVFRDVTVRFINGSVPVCTQENLKDERLSSGRKNREKKDELVNPDNSGLPKTFEHIALMALSPDRDGEGFRGLEALGVLKADVDNLGLLMCCGIKPERFTPARLLTLSRQMHWYFALYLPHLLKTTPEFNDIYTVFAGGDDLFLIGPWNRVVELAANLHASFAKYVCKNDKVHFSAGITLNKTHTALDALAHQAETALGASKDSGRNRVTLFNQTVTWSEFSALRKIKAKLLEWRESALINNAMLYRLDQFIAMSREEKLVREQPEIHIDRLQCLKWRAFFHYMAERNVGKDVKGETAEDKKLRKAERIGEFRQAFDWIETHRAGLKIALWDVIYNQRKGA